MKANNSGQIVKAVLLAAILGLLIYTTLFSFINTIYLTVGGATLKTPIGLLQAFLFGMMIIAIFAIINFSIPFGLIGVAIFYLSKRNKSKLCAFFCGALTVLLCLSFWLLITRHPLKSLFSFEASPAQWYPMMPGFYATLILLVTGGIIGLILMRHFKQSAPK